MREDSSTISLSNKPPSHLGIGDLTLHSPSSIVGTPFDVSPKFEYPFPPSMPDHQSTVSSIHATSSSSATFPAMPAIGPHSLIFPTSQPHQHRDSFSATHFKLQHRDPPVPPRLSTKEWSLAMNTPGRPRSHAKRYTKKPIILPISRPLERSASLSIVGPVDSARSASGPR